MIPFLGDCLCEKHIKSCQHSCSKETTGRMSFQESEFSLSVSFGIAVPWSFDLHVKYNISTLIDTCGTDVEQWCTLPLSTAGRVNAIKEIKNKTVMFSIQYTFHESWIESPRIKHAQTVNSHTSPSLHGDKRKQSESCVWMLTLLWIYSWCSLEMLGNKSLLPRNLSALAPVLLHVSRVFL